MRKYLLLILLIAFNLGCSNNINFNGSASFVIAEEDFYINASGELTKNSIQAVRTISKGDYFGTFASIGTSESDVNKIEIILGGNRIIIKNAKNISSTINVDFKFQFNNHEYRAELYVSNNGFIRIYLDTKNYIEFRLS